jgi:hypothetical protein
MQEIIQLLNVVYADVQCVSGAVSKSNRAQDEVFTDGSVRYINPKLLRPFAKARQAAARLCRIHGTRFLSGWAIPDASLNAVRDGLAAISTEVAMEKAQLMAGLSGRMMDWESKHPEIIPYRAKFPTTRSVDESIGMFVSIYKISPSEVGHESIRDGIKAEVGGLAARVLTEITQDVRDAWSTNNDCATTRSRRVLERIAMKLESLAFVGGDLGEVAVMVHSVLDVLPTSGKIQGNDFIILSGLMNTLIDPTRTIATAKMARRQSPASLWGNFTAAPETPMELVEDATPPAQDVAVLTVAIFDPEQDVATATETPEHTSDLNADPTADAAPVVDVGALLASIKAPPPPIASASAWNW